MRLRSKRGVIARLGAAAGVALAGLLLLSAACAASAPAASPAGALWRTPLRELPDALQTLWRTARPLRGIDTGPPGAPQMLVFFDPNCPACARLWPRVRPQMRQLRLRWIPVAWARPDSLGVAAALLEAPDPAAALARNEQGFDAAQGHGARMAAYTVAPATRAAVARNTALWRDQIGMLPTLMYRDATGVHLFIGTPSAAQWQALLRRLGP